MGSSPILGTIRKSKMNCSTVFMRTLSFLTFFLPLFYGALYSEVADERLVYIRGEALLARDVLDQVEEQAGVRLILRVEDQKQFRKDYDDLVSVEQVLDALKSYYQNQMGIELKIKPFGQSRLLIYRDVEVLPQVSESEADSSGEVTALSLPVVEVEDLDGLGSSVEAMGSFASDTLALPAADGGGVSASLPDDVEAKEADVSAVTDPVDFSHDHDAGLLSVEVIGKRAVYSDLGEWDASDAEEKSREDGLVDLDEPDVPIPDALVLDSGLSDLDEEVFNTPPKPSFWERVESLLGSDRDYAPFVASNAWSGPTLGMLRSRDVGADILGLSVTAELVSMSRPQHDGEFFLGALAYGWSLPDEVQFFGYDVRGLQAYVELTAGYENSESQSVLAQVSSRVYGPTAVEVGVAQDVLLSDLFDSRWMARLKLPLGESKGWMGSQSWGFGLGYQASRSVLDGEVSAQLDAVYQSDHDAFGSVRPVVLSMDVNWTQSFYDMAVKARLGLKASSSPFESSSFGLDREIVQLYLDLSSGRQQLPLALRLYVGATDVSPTLGLSVTWFPEL